MSEKTHDLPPFEDQEELLREEGYDSGAPSAFASDIDAEVCASIACDNCEHHGMRYAPFTMKGSRSYRAFAICPSCGFWIEF